MLSGYRIREVDGTVRELEKEEWDVLFKIPGLMFWNRRENIETLLDCALLIENYKQGKCNEDTLVHYLFKWDSMDVYGMVQNEFKKYTGKDLVIG
jgi:hypothetical protein